MGIFKRRGIRNLVLGFALLSMLVLSACESVGSVDLNQVLKSSLDTVSMQGQSSISLEVVLDEEMLAEEGLTGEDTLLISMLQNIKLELNEMKQQDLSTVSGKGSLSLGDIELPFALSVDPSEMVIQVEGIAKPIVLKTDLELMEELLPGLDYEQYADLQIDLASALLDYVLPSLPNPKTIEVEHTSVTINGEEVPVYQVHSVVQSDEFIDLFEQFVNHLVQDEEGLRNTLSVMYDLLMPMFEQLIEADADIAADPVFVMFQNKALAVEFAYDILTTVMEDLIAEFEQIKADLAEGLQFLSDESYVSIDLYVDQDLTIRKTEHEVLFKPSEPADGLVSIMISSSQEIWGINEPVTADMIEYDEYIDPTWDPVLPHIEAGSTLAELLVSFGLNEEEIRVFPLVAPKPSEYHRAYLTDGTTLASGDWLASELSVHLTYDEEAGRVELFDPVSDRTITLTIGENSMSVDGEAREIHVGAAEHYGIPFIPLRAVAEEFGAEVEWDGENRIVIIKKTYF